MKLNVGEMARQVLAESGEDRGLMWKQETGIRATSVRIDISLKQHSAGLLHQLAWLADELPRIIARTNKEDGEDDRLWRLEQELKRVRQRLTKRRPRRDA